MFTLQPLIRVTVFQNGADSEWWTHATPPNGDFEYFPYCMERKIFITSPDAGKFSDLSGGKYFRS